MVRFKRIPDMTQYYLAYLVTTTKPKYISVSYFLKTTTITIVCTSGIEYNFKHRLCAFQSVKLFFFKGT